MEKLRFFNFFFWNVRETTRHFSPRSQNSEYPRIFRVTGANQNARKLLSTDLVNTYDDYSRSSIAKAWHLPKIRTALYFALKPVPEPLLSVWKMTNKVLDDETRPSSEGGFPPWNIPNIFPVSLIPSYTVTVSVSLSPRKSKCVNIKWILWVELTMIFQEQSCPFG